MKPSHRLERFAFLETPCWAAFFPISYFLKTFSLLVNDLDLRPLLIFFPVSGFISADHESQR